MTIDIEALGSSVSSLSLNSENPDEETFFQKLWMIYFREYNGRVINKYIYRNQMDVVKMNKIIEGINLNSGNKTIYNSDIDKEDFSIWERSHDNGVLGIVTKAWNLSYFDNWMINLVLSTANIRYPFNTCPNLKIYTHKIIDIFVNTLKNTTAHDKWTEGGSIYFEKKVDFFTSKNLTIEAVLPAFPCKSSNLNKVAGWKPDKGEEMALTKLCEFAAKVKEVYPPGMLIWIVSDGHVFSDCIGVDDFAVNSYNEELKKLYNRINKSGKCCIKFCSLLDIFQLKNFPIDPEILSDIDVTHHLGTRLDEESENCRKLMIHSCDSDQGSLKEDISKPDHPRLFLFRGFSKFMEEDLADHPKLLTLSKKKTKKAVAQIAFEMIKRNDAYSNLVEIFFPMHLRLSIHAHNNSGPKYGVKLLDSKLCKAVKSIEECSTPSYDDLLHIPTPWHNSIFKLKGKEFYYITKSEIIKKAMIENDYQGSWKEEEGYFELEKV